MQVLKEEVRKQILLSAEKKFCEKGFLETTTRSIAMEAKISVSNLYLYYENKETLFLAVAEPIFRQFNSMLQDFLVHSDPMDDLSRNISLGMGKIITAGLNGFLLLSEKSKGTKYEGFRELLVEELKNHILVQLHDSVVDKELMARVFSKSLIEGIIHIAKEHTPQKQLEQCLQQLADYHTDGIRRFLK